MVEVDSLDLPSPAKFLTFQLTAMQRIMQISAERLVRSEHSLIINNSLLSLTLALFGYKVALTLMPCQFSNGRKLRFGHAQTALILSRNLRCPPCESRMGYFACCTSFNNGSRK